ncbi:MAG: twin-arginine translocase subunit TatC [Bacteroidales bacterium]|nr:twin-arginine translocase subunit TatC [Candidatus Colimorpha merdihippi]
MDFWEHLDELRSYLVKAVVAVVLCAVAAFCCKEWLFAIVMAPSSPDFFIYRTFTRLTGISSDFHVDMFNPELAQQFLVHMKVSLWMGLLIVSPYVLYLLFHFVAPGLYAHERRYAIRAVGGGYVMFLLGVALNYFLIFPLTFRFLGTYQVSPDVPNQIALTSYVGMLLMLCFLMGVMFELPILCWLLAKIGVLKSHFMTKYRRHAIVVILIIAAVITPTGDPFTLTLVALPIYALYEMSVVIVKKTVKS